MSTTSTAAFEQAIRTRLLTFTPLSGVPLSTTLGTRCYIDQAPESPTYPYAVQRLRLMTDGIDGQYRVQGMLELMLYNHPASARQATKAAADVAVQALRDWAQTGGDGLIRVSDATWAALPPFPAPADREMVAIRVTATLYAYPQFFTQYATNAA